MKLWSWLTGTPKMEPAAGMSRAPVPAPLTVSGRATLGGRLSVDTKETFFGAPRVVLPPPDAESHWRFADLDSHTLSRMRPTELLQLLADLSPDISRALWDWLRLANPGWECTALRPGSDDPDPRAQAVLDALFAALQSLYGAVDVVIARLYLGAFLRGAFMGELVLDEAGRVAVDLATPDPATARFERRRDPVRGTVWQLGQWQGGTGFVALDRPTIRYIPVDPLPGSSYGRAPATPALFSTLFLLGMLHDLRRVVQQQGYPRLDIAIITEKLKELMPVGIAADQQKAWIDGIITEITDTYRRLQPDDAFIHLDVAELNQPVGTVDSDSLGAIDGLIEALERMNIRALKTMPLLMGVTDGVSEANANRQWEIHAAGIKAIQHLCEQLLEHLLTVALQAQGIQATVQFRFAELRAAEMLRDAQTEALQIANEREKYAAGWINQDEASLAVTGHPSDQAEPRQGNVASGDADDAADVQADPGSNRTQRNGYHPGPLPVEVR